jgi:hypothetical protein
MIRQVYSFQELRKNRHFPGRVATAVRATVTGGGFRLKFQKQVYFDPLESDFRALQGKHLAGLDFRGFRYTDG